MEQKDSQREKPHVVIIDNYDSFTYNLVQAFGELEAQVSVILNDQIPPEEIALRHPTHLCISPGPGSPETAGISKEVIQHYQGKIPLLGVCLGYQCIVEVFGGEIVHASQILQGKTSMVEHQKTFPFQNISNPFIAMRYHSLIANAETLPPCLEPLAWTEAQELMAVRHRSFPILGLQFHPESILTLEGNTILSNFLKWNLT